MPVLYAWGAIMSTKTYRRSFVISVPAERMEAFYIALERLKTQFPRFSQSAIIVHLVLDPSGERLTEAYTTRHDRVPPVPDMPAHIDPDACKSSLGVSIAEAVRQPFFDALDRLEERTGHKGKSAIMIDLVVKAADRLDDIVHSAAPARAQEHTRLQPAPAAVSSPSVSLPDLVLEPHDIPSLFRSLFYEQLQQEPADRQRTIAAITQAIDDFVPQTAEAFALQALNRQLLGVLLRDNDDFNAALEVLDQAQADAHALESLLPAEAINLLAAAHYRRASIFLYQHNRLPRTERVARQGVLGEAHRALEAAMDVSRHPDCRPCVRGVIVVSYARLLAMPEVRPLPPFEEIEQYLEEARSLAAAEQEAGRDGYDPVGFLYHPAGVLHIRAQITLEVFRADARNVPETLSLAHGEEYIAQAIEQLPPTWKRLRDGCELTRMQLLRVGGIAKLKAATVVTSEFLARLAEQPSPQIHHDFDTELALLFATRDEINGYLSTLIQREKS
jgi:hypothetical protein